VELDPMVTAVVLVDLQVGVTAMPVVPHTADEVVANAAKLVAAARAAGATVAFVRVDYGEGNALQVRVPNDAQMSWDPPAGWSQLDPRLGAVEGDVVVTKHVVSGFHATDLDLQLRRRGITTLVVGGIATHMGVEGTVRSAFDHGYAQVLVEDAMGAMTEEQHRYPVAEVFPIVGHVATTDAVVEALGA
jgi:nicotinamidase-related amidase